MGRQTQRQKPASLLPTRTHECKKLLLISFSLTWKLITMFPRISNLLPKSSSINGPLYHLHFSSSASATRTPFPKPTFIVEYLINSWGFSPEKATAASKRISHLTSPDRPDSVTHFLKHQGFADAQIRTLISRYPRILCTDVNRTVGPNLTALRKMGFPENDLHKVVLSNPHALLLRSAVPRLEFWRTFLHGDIRKLISAFARNRALIDLDIDRNIAPKIALLKDYDLSETDIGLLLVRGNCFINKSLATMGSLLKQTQEFGFPRGSPMFLHSLSSLCGIRSATFKTKMELFEIFGWSQEDLISAFLKFPRIIRYSEENIRAKMEFFIGTAGCTQKYISVHPTLLGYSLEKRLIPRYQVIQILKSKDLVQKEQDLYQVIRLSENSFVESIIVPHKVKEPMLLETYISASAGKLLSD